MIAIVLPVYNGEKYLASAIDSVLNQTYTGWELLVVDDGSTDETASICNNYARMDSRIKVFHQPNGGVNTARAKGIDYARGEYITFLDADDSFTPDALEIMVGAFGESVDIVACGELKELIDQKQYLTYLWTGRLVPGICTKMYRLGLFKKIDYRLDRRLAMGEDLLLNSMYSLWMDKAVVLPRSVYNINKDNASSVTKTFKHNWEYEKFYFNNVYNLFLSKLRQSDSYSQVELLVNKSWLNAMKYSILDSGSINYKDIEFSAVQSFFKDKKVQLGLSEKMIFAVKSPWLYRVILKAYMALKNVI